MTISGTLETFSLPELFRLLDSGSKSGRLIFQSSPDINNPESQLYYLWFEQGWLVAVSDRLHPQNLIALLESRGWLNNKIATKLEQFCPENEPMGIYLKRLKLVTSEQLREIFDFQLNIVYRLFENSTAWFQLDEISENSKIESLQTLPWLDMTGESIRATDIVLYALRSQKNWNIFIEQLPEASYALQKLTPRPDLQLLPLELKILEFANGEVSLKAIATKIDESFTSVQKAAFRLILAGLIDEIPMANGSFSAVNPSDGSFFSPPRTTLTDNCSQTAIKNQPTEKSRVSLSLLKNLINFLRKKLW